MLSSTICFVESGDGIEDPPCSWCQIGSTESESVNPLRWLIHTLWQASQHPTLGLGSTFCAQERRSSTLLGLLQIEMPSKELNINPQSISTKKLMIHLVQVDIPTQKFAQLETCICCILLLMESFGIAFGFIQFQSRGALTEKSPIRSGPMYLKFKKNESKWHHSQKGG